MITVPIPGRPELRIEHLLVDYNGTVVVDGEPIDGVLERLERLAESVTIRILTAATRGSAAARTSGWPVELAIIGPGPEDVSKLAFARDLGFESVAAIGNGLNDRLLLGAAAVGVAVVQDEGIAAPTLAAADVVVPDIRAGLDLFLHPERLLATLRR